MMMTPGPSAVCARDTGIGGTRNFPSFITARHGPLPLLSSTGVIEELSLGKLSSELLVCIIEQLCLLDITSVFTIRSVCRIFNALATPVAYRTVVLNDAIVHQDSHKRFPRALEHISLHTREVFIRNNLMPTGIRRILGSMRNLSSVTIRHVRDEFSGPVSWVPSDILDYDQMRRDRTKLRIESLPLGGTENDLHQSLLDPTLTRHLVSLQLASPTPPLTTKSESLKRLLVQCHSLEALYYEDVGRGTSFTFDEGDRIPAVSALSLKSYDWNHSRETVQRHWDLSRLQSLTLSSMPVFNFLRSINPEDLRDLRALVVHDCSPQAPDRREDASRGLYSLVKEHITALETLNLTCHTRLFPINAITRHGTSLRELRFRDHVGFQHDDDTCPTFSPDEVATLARCLPFVHTLELDMDVAFCNPRDFLQAVCLFPKLQTFVLHVQTLIRPDEKDDSSRDRDYDSAMQTFSFLVRLREKQNPYLPWESITINVGGWRRVMLRRLGLDWKRKNAKGVFAERCFVLKRDSSVGQHRVWEEKCHDGLDYVSPAQL